MQKKKKKRRRLSGPAMLGHAPHASRSIAPSTRCLVDRRHTWIDVIDQFARRALHATAIANRPRKCWLGLQVISRRAYKNETSRAF
jgi:hypothetical protein